MRIGILKKLRKKIFFEQKGNKYIVYDKYDNHECTVSSAKNAASVVRQRILIELWYGRYSWIEKKHNPRAKKL